ncbi:MAG TPA: VC0807 family protein [Stackebrandtia sp.]|jgi:hypothetical protein|uniref:VC0807 family protein n=1 Tax=Stackebrandtia sp. TaxID=2023065 RepID=UPI002D281EE5|nr:VC0807 family protein [Stackebrandtia sp.]HZE38669.1 VC0807 family protein [Stackebrandtia sp.]
MEASKRSRIISVAIDVALSPAVFYGLTIAGFGTATALIGATATAGLRLAYTVIRSRKLDGLACFMVAMYGLMLLMVVLTRDERLLLSRDPLTSGIAGLAFLASCATSTPATAYIGRRLHGKVPDDPTALRDSRVQTFVWGAALTAEAGVRMAMIFVLPVTVTAGVSPIIELAVIAVVAGWNLWYRKNLRRRSVRSAAQSANAARV